MLKNFFQETFSKTKIDQPFSRLKIVMFLGSLLVILAITAGYYHQLWSLEKKKYAGLEDRYVRVRNMLGREYMQNLIDESYLESDTNIQLEDENIQLEDENIQLEDENIQNEDEEIQNEVE